MHTCYFIGILKLLPCRNLVPRRRIKIFCVTYNRRLKVQDLFGYIQDPMLKV